MKLMYSISMWDENNHKTKQYCMFWNVGKWMTYYTMRNDVSYTFMVCNLVFSFKTLKKCLKNFYQKIY